MSKITQITVQQRDKNRVSLFVDGKYSLSLSIDQMLGEKLIVGADVTEVDIKKLKKLSVDGKLYDRVLAKLARRQHSEKEIRQYLQQKNSGEELIDEIIDKLNNKGYLNDRQFAENWIKNRRELKKRSNRALRSELMQKGILSTTIDELLASSKENELAALQQMIEKKQKITRYKDNKKLIQYLLRQGFKYQDIKDCLIPEDV